MRVLSLRAAALTAALSFLAVPAVAQSFWLDHGSSELSLEVLHPTPDMGEFTFFSFAAFATAAVQIGEEALLVVELPFSRGEFDFEGEEGEATVGNPYVGLQSMPAERTGFRGSVGIRIPLASEDGGVATSVGVMSAASDRFEAFIPDLVAINAAGRYVGALSDLAYVSGRLGALVDLPTGNGDAEFFLQYGARAWVESEGLSTGLGLSGRYLVSESDLAFADRTLHELGLWGEYALGSVRPGIRIQLPLGDLSNIVDHVIGIYIRYEWP